MLQWWRSCSTDSTQTISLAPEPTSSRVMIVRIPADTWPCGLRISTSTSFPWSVTRSPIRTRFSVRATFSVAGMRWLFAVCEGRWPTTADGMVASYQ